ncbi:MAG: ABC-type transport system involved in multi-copper enzyme maturation, permease component [Planctomycetota bacterium]|nr:ABC-type transport system involved in multi-copper enzyme maturation, permease component [Planctomycetota bacterium]
MRIGLGPVFAYEWLRTARNWRVYAMRFLFGLGMLVVLAMTATSNSQAYQYRQLSEIQAQAEAGQSFSMAIVSTQLALLLLIAPAATAGTLCLDKQRGTLAHVLVTDLTGAEIVLGKLTARLLPVLGLILSSLGIMAVCTLMGGIDPVGLSGAMLVTLGSAVLAACLAFCLSVWAGKTHEVVMTTYLILIAWLVFYPGWYVLTFMGLGVTAPPDWLQLTHPFWIVADVRPGAVPIHRHALFMVGCLVLSAGLLTLATARLRSVAIHQMNRPARSRKRWRKARDGAALSHEAPPTRKRWLFRLWPGPSLDKNPVLWREWHRAKPSRWLRGIWWAYALASISLTCLGVWLISMPGGRGGPEGAMILINGFQVSLGLLLLSVSAATALAEERVRGSLDVLLATPLPTGSIVWGKWWGAFRTVPVLAIAPGVLAAAGVFLFNPQTSLRFGGRVPIVPSPRSIQEFLNNPPRSVGIFLVMGLTLSYGAALTSFGLAMATWISRLDRAVAATVSLYVFMTVGWLFLTAILFQNDDIHGPGLCTASPFMGAAYTSQQIIEYYSPSERRWATQCAWAFFWILAYFTVASLLLKFTLATFNRKLGRIPEEGAVQARTPPVAKPKLELALIAD